MNTNSTPVKAQIRVYADGVCMGIFNGWKNARTAIARYEAAGRDVYYNFA